MKLVIINDANEETILTDTNSATPVTPDPLTQGLIEKSFTDSGGGRVAFVMGEDGLAHKRMITLGVRSVNRVEGDPKLIVLQHRLLHCADVWLLA